MSNSKNWFDVDRKGLAKLLERRGGKAWVIFELLSNAWDEDGCTEVAVEIEAIEGRRPPRSASDPRGGRCSSSARPRAATSAAAWARSWRSWSRGIS